MGWYKILSICFLFLALCTVLGVIIKLNVSTSQQKVEINSTSKNITPHMQENSQSQEYIDDDGDEGAGVPKPPIVSPDEPKFKYADEYELVTLTEEIPLVFHGIKLTLKGFNHKFQDSTDESYVWVNVVAQSDSESDLVEEMVFHEHRFIDEHGDSQTLRTTMEFGGYLFELTDVGYGYTIDLHVRKLIDPQ